VDFVFVAYLLSVALIMVFFGWGHKYFNQVLVTHILITLAIFVLAYYGGPGSNPVLMFIRTWYPLLLPFYLYPESGLINNLFLDAPLDPMYIALEKSIFRCEPAMILPAKFNHRFLMEYFHFSYFHLLPLSADYLSGALSQRQTVFRGISLHSIANFTLLLFDLYLFPSNWPNPSAPRPILWIFHIADGSNLPV